MNTGLMIDMEFVNTVQMKYGNMHGFHWTMTENDGTITGWYWDSENDDTKETDMMLIEDLLKHLKIQGCENCLEA
jgi:predicted RecB family nuclease